MELDTETPMERSIGTTMEPPLDLPDDSHGVLLSPWKRHVTPVNEKIRPRRKLTRAGQTSRFRTAERNAFASAMAPLSPIWLFINSKNFVLVCANALAIAMTPLFPMWFPASENSNNSLLCGNACARISAPPSPMPLLRMSNLVIDWLEWRFLASLSAARGNLRWFHFLHARAS